MPRRNNPIEDFVRALSDKRVKDLLGEIVQDKLTAALKLIEELKQENIEKTEQINKLSGDLETANCRIDELEAYNRRENLIFCGLELANAAETASVPDESSTDRSGENEHAAVTEGVVLALCREKLGVQLTPADISIAHRLRKAPRSKGPAPVIVRFANRKAREAVYAARFKLKSTKVFINEDLTSSTAKLFFKVRTLVNQKAIHSAWTRSGAIYCKLTSDPGCRPTVIKSESDLPRIN